MFFFLLFFISIDISNAHTIKIITINKLQFKVIERKSKKKARNIENNLWISKTISRNWFQHKANNVIFFVGNCFYGHPNYRWVTFIELSIVYFFFWYCMQISKIGVLCIQSNHLANVPYHLYVQFTFTML